MIFMLPELKIKKLSFGKIKSTYFIIFILLKLVFNLISWKSIILIPKELLWADILSYLYIVMMSVICFKLFQHRDICERERERICMCVLVWATLWGLSLVLMNNSHPRGDQPAFNQKGHTQKAAATAFKLSTS